MAYQRDYKREYALQKKRGESGTGSNSGNAQRHRLRYAAEKAGLVHKGDGKDVDHKKALKKGGSNTLSNARVTSKHANRSFPRNKDGSMRSNT
jgi:hypothetical protein